MFYFAVFRRILEANFWMSHKCVSTKSHVKQISFEQIDAVLHTNEFAEIQSDYICKNKPAELIPKSYQWRFSIKTDIFKTLTYFLK